MGEAEFGERPSVRATSDVAVCALRIAIASAYLLAGAAPARACDRGPCLAPSEEGIGDMATDTRKPRAFWSHPIPWSQEPPHSLVIIGSKQDGRFNPSSVAASNGLNEHMPPQKAAFPLETNLIASLDARIFGIEERATASRRGDALIIDCAAGSRPAGVVLSSEEFRFPRGMNGNLHVEGDASAAFGFSLARWGTDAPVSRRSRTAASTLLAAIPARDWREGDVELGNLVISCPRQAATATLSSISLAPISRSPTSGIGTWVWDIGRWLDNPHGLAAEATGLRIKNAFLQLRIVDGKVADADSVRRLIDVLSASGISAHAVEGDAEMATQRGRGNALARAGAIRYFIKADGMLRSVQYDIEPYLRSDHVADPKASWEAWSSTIEKLAAVLRDKVSVVVPFWMLDDPAGATALDGAVRWISNVTVMAYRSDPLEVEGIAEGWLNWGAAHGLQIGIALENGPIDSEFHRTFVRAERGDVTIDRSGQPQTVSMLTAKVTDSYTEPVYLFSHEIKVDPARISFLDERSKLTEATSRLGRTLSAWASFDGILVHELIAGRRDASESARPE